jgi:hypothetical protein
MSMVYILWHTHEPEPDYEDVKLIGVYSSQANAEAARKKLSGQSGFRDTLDGFEIAEAILDDDDWKEGFFSYQNPIDGEDE